MLTAFVYKICERNVVSVQEFITIRANSDRESVNRMVESKDFLDVHT